MRVIAGTYRSRLLSAPRGTATRPTSDRLRETLFNVLAPRIAGSRFVDLYAGSGAVGIEALSRGAPHVSFIENAVSALTTIRKNLAALAISRGFAIEERSVSSALQRMAKTGEPAGLVFLDPPYQALNEYEETLNLLGGPLKKQLLASDALVIAEHSSKAQLSERYGTLQRTRLIRQGDAALSFYLASAE